jgi:hypothetical protein
MSSSRLNRSGFTIAEVLVYLVIAVVVVAGVYKVLIGQNRLYMKQRELQDVRGSLRAAANLLAFELRQISAAGGDLYSIGTYDLSLRSVQASGIVCAKHSTQPRLGLYATSGDFEDTSDDSILVFSVGAAGTGDDQWIQSGVQGTYSPAAGGVPDCAWSASTATPDIVVEVDSTAVFLSGVEVGGPIREFRKVEYGLYFDADGRWWLGRKVGNAANYEKLTGPLSAPSDSGLAFVYYDSNGTVTAVAADVRMVDIILRGESYGKAPQFGDLGPQVEEDSLTVRVSTRG